MIRTKSVGKSTQLTVVNYTGYQDKRNANGTEVNSKWNASGTEVNTDNKDNNFNNENKPRRQTKFIAPTPAEVEEYAKEKGYSIDGDKVCAFYEDGDKWVDSKGKQVKRWKQKVLAVWCKDENKIIPHDPGVSQERILEVLAEIEAGTDDPDEGLVIDD